MERTRATRVAVAALLVAMAGVLSIPLKLAGGASSLRTVGEPSATTTTATLPPPPVSIPTSEPPLPVVDDSVVSDEPFVAPDLSAPAGVDDATGSFAAPAPFVSAPAAPASSDVPGTHVRAVVVGIDDYPGDAHDLRSSVADGRDMVAALERWGVPPQNVLALENGQATAGGVVRALDWLVDNAGPDDTAVFFFSGHARNLGFGTQALVGSDGWLLTDRYLADVLAPLPARSTWIALSVCYGGGFDELLAPGRILTAAADADSLAYENESFGRSYLGQYLIRLALLQGRAGGPIVQQAVAWAQSYLARDAPDRQIVQFDMSREPISIDGVRRTSEAPPQALPPPGFTDGGEPLPPAPPPTVAPPAGPPTTVCRNLFNLLCPR